MSAADLPHQQFRKLCERFARRAFELTERPRLANMRELVNDALEVEATLRFLGRGTRRGRPRKESLPEFAAELDQIQIPSTTRARIREWAKAKGLTANEAEALMPSLEKAYASRQRLKGYL